MANSRAKGCRGEREARDYLIKLGFGEKGETRRGQQHTGGPDSPDVVCPALERVHIEVKRTESIGLGTQELEDACGQAYRDAKGKRWAVLWKNNRQAWRLTFGTPTIACVFSTVAGNNDVRAVLTLLNTPTN